MKIFLLLSIIGTLLLSAGDCNQKKDSAAKFKAQLEIKGICSNYTLRLLDGDMDTSKIMQQWTDENTNKTYQNVFALENPCSFPAGIKQGDDFYFTIDTTKPENCIVCMAYYPKPPRALRIKVVAE